MSTHDATDVHPGRDGLYEARIEAAWDIAGNANGGYLMAIAAEDRTPVTLTAHFLAPGKPGPVTVATDVEKRGRRFTTATARLSDADRPLVTMVGSYADSPPRHTAIERVDAQPT